MSVMIIVFHASWISSITFHCLLHRSYYPTSGKIPYFKVRLVLLFIVPNAYVDTHYYYYYYYHPSNTVYNELCSLLCHNISLPCCTHWLTSSPFSFPLATMGNKYHSVTRWVHQTLYCTLHLVTHNAHTSLYAHTSLVHFVYDPLLSNILVFLFLCSGQYFTT